MTAARRAPVLRLKRGRERPLVHPWIFKGDVASVSDVAPGDPVTVLDAGGRFVGRGFFNARPALCCRLLTRVDEALDAAFFARRIAEAAAWRAPGGVPPALGRLVWSEGDGLPGLVVDRYGAVLVIQCVTLGMARVRDTAVAALRGVLGDLRVYLADDETPARLEGFAPQRGWLGPPGPDAVVVDEGGPRFAVTFGRGHKTGLYLDQRENRAVVAPVARGRDVLDAFAYTGGFAVHALVAGARRAVCLESSPDAIAGLGENLALNAVEDRAQIVAGNAFDELRRLERGRARFGLIVLDPPPFARGRTALAAALRGYKEINLRAMRMLEPGGVLATFSCSHHVDDAAFMDVCREAAADAGVPLRVRRTLGQSADHPVLLAVPETGYLKGLLLEAV
ncbi:MAG: class I SAM-dependent rRNA methyltransferase [Candidatus Rokubacteria bacterium]|nr:class I SAM-dependent rRNA methyltransferase [Candidatus Rokubacteria bacterium]